jgi:NAD(P)-dependent dehydrogenase (short-subunit alcohol dehydrogenase family)
MSDIRFDGRTAIVTGAGRGLGRAYARLLASRGAAAVVDDYGTDPDGSNPSPKPAHEVAEEIVAEGGTAVACTESVVTPAGAHAVAATALDNFGRIDILVNNAGIVIPRPFEQTSPEIFQKHLDVNVLGQAAMAQACWPQLTANRGNVVHIASSSMIGIDVLSAYGASKGGAYALMRTLAVVGKPSGVRVNAVFPLGSTRMVEASGGAVPTPEIRAFVDRELAPAKVAPVVGFLAHADCPVTGQAFTAGRGRVALVFVGETPGYRSDDLTIEAVAANFDQVRDTSTFFDFFDSDEMMAYVMGIDGDAT